MKPETVTQDQGVSVWLTPTKEPIFYSTAALKERFGVNVAIALPRHHEEDALLVLAEIIEKLKARTRPLGARTKLTLATGMVVAFTSIVYGQETYLQALVQNHAIYDLQGFAKIGTGFASLIEYDLAAYRASTASTQQLSLHMASVYNVPRLFYITEFDGMPVVFNTNASGSWGYFGESNYFVDTLEKFIDALLADECPPIVSMVTQHGVDYFIVFFSLVCEDWRKSIQHPRLSNFETCPTLFQVTAIQVANEGVIEALLDSDEDDERFEICGIAELPDKGGDELVLELNVQMAVTALPFRTDADYMLFRSKANLN